MDFVARYQALLCAGLDASARSAQTVPIRNLLERLILGREHVLTFFDDITIPLNNRQQNNQAERNLRMLKA